MENEWGSVTVSELSCDAEDPFGRRALTRSWGLFAEGRGEDKKEKYCRETWIASAIAKVRSRTGNSASRHALGVNLALDRVFFSLQEEIIVTLFQFKGLCAPGLFRSAESTISDDFPFRDFTRELTYKIFLNSNILRTERGNLLGKVYIVVLRYFNNKAIIKMHPLQSQ